MTRHFDHQIDSLKEKIVNVGTLVEEAIAKAISALTTRDLDEATAVIDEDAEIDRKEVNVEEEVLKILALYQPVATDLRFVVAILKINNGLERMGDLAKNIAKRVVALSDGQRKPLPVDFRALSAKAQSMARQSLDALVQSDVALARQVLAAEPEVREMRRALQEQIRGMIAAQPEQTEFFMDLLSITRHLARWPTWSRTWPKRSSTWSTARSCAITGQRSNLARPEVTRSTLRDQARLQLRRVFAALVSRSFSAI